MTTTGMQPWRDIPRVRWTRVVHTFDQSAYRPLFGFGAARDGGLIIDVGAYAPEAQWEYGKAVVPGGWLAGTLGEVVRDTVVSGLHAPKLHYHRSGFLSLDQTAKLPRVGITATPIRQLQEGQCFSLSIAGVDRYAERPLKVGDLFFRPEVERVAVSVIGVVGRVEQMTDQDRSSFGGRNSTVIVSPERRAPEPTILLTGHGLDCWVRLEFFEERSNDDEFSCALFGFDPARVESNSPREIVGVWTKGASPRRILVSEQHRLPGHPTSLNRLMRENFLKNVDRLSRGE